MAILDWGTFAGVVVDTDILGSVTGDVDGVSVTVTTTNDSEGSSTGPRIFPYYTDSGTEPFDGQSVLKIYSGGIDPDASDGPSFLADTVTIEFNDPENDEDPQAFNPEFRISAVNGFGGDAFETFTVRAYDKFGNELTVNSSLGSNISAGPDDSYIGGSADVFPGQPDSSAYFSVDGQVSRIEIEYLNEEAIGTDDFILLSDIHFDSVEPAVDHERFSDPEPVDADPFDDRDIVSGDSDDNEISSGDDNDSISGFGGNDTLDGGWDDDTIDGGDGNDSIIGGRGNDSIEGDSGNDTIDAGGDPEDDYYSDHEGPGSVPDDQKFVPSGLTSEPTPGTIITHFSDPNPNDDLDFVDGGAGNDSILTGDDSDTVFGGSGNDYIDGGIDDDELHGDGGSDTIVGGHGNDDIQGDAGDDVIYASYESLSDPDNLLYENVTDDTDPLVDNDRDSVDGGGGSDVIYGGDDDDTLRGGTGEDRLYGEIDEDELYGDGGNDTLDGGQGADTISGGLGNDYILNITEGDVIDGNEDPGDGDIDVMDLTGDQVDNSRPGLTTDAEKLLINNRIIADPNNPGEYIRINFNLADLEQGTVDFLDENFDLTGVASFDNIEKIIVCFTPGTRIATPRGELCVEDLVVGDRVITRDNGIQEIRWVGHRQMDAAELEMKDHLRPVLIRKGALGDGLPERDMKISPNHRMLVANEKTAFYFEEREVLVAAKHLVGMPGIEWADVDEVTYIHFMFDNHEIVLSDGAWSESFQPGDYSLQGIGDAQRREILELFPELAKPEGIAAYQAARRSLKKFEAQLLIQ